MNGKIELKISEDDCDVGYLSLPNHPGKGNHSIVAKQIDLREYIQYKGPSIYLDFDEDNNIIGIEIVG